MELRPFSSGRAALVASWAATAREATLWCGHTDGLVPTEKVLAWATEDGVRPFGLFDSEELVGYGELWLDDEEHEVELARLIVDPRRRGQGLGRALVTGLTRLAREHYPQVFLRVHPDNAAALRCYAAAGFVPVDPALQAEWNAPQPVAYAWLTTGDG
jgi:ribosomal protein S18 acetylase RimI-like enzyme